MNPAVRSRAWSEQGPQIELAPVFKNRRNGRRQPSLSRHELWPVWRSPTAAECWSRFSRDCVAGCRPRVTKGALQGGALGLQAPTSGRARSSSYDDQRPCGRHLRKCGDRLAALDVLRAREAFSDVVRESQEFVELATQGMLRRAGHRPAEDSRCGRPRAAVRGAFRR